jgi:hypothetical protein
MKAENPNLVLWLNCWRHGVARAPKKLFFCFFCFWFIFLFCKLLGRDLGELVLVMECNPSCSMEFFNELCELQLSVWIGAEISRK